MAVGTDKNGFTVSVNSHVFDCSEGSFRLGKWF